MVNSIAKAVKGILVLSLKILMLQELCELV
jgi:hypothetical protein